MGKRKDDRGSSEEVIIPATPPRHRKRSQATAANHRHVKVSKCNSNDRPRPDCSRGTDEVVGSVISNGRTPPSLSVISDGRTPPSLSVISDGRTPPSLSLPMQADNAHRHRSAEELIDSVISDVHSQYNPIPIDLDLNEESSSESEGRAREVRLIVSPSLNFLTVNIETAIGSDSNEPIIDLSTPDTPRRRKSKGVERARSDRRRSDRHRQLRRPRQESAVQLEPTDSPSEDQTEDSPIFRSRRARRRDNNELFGRGGLMASPEESATQDISGVLNRFDNSMDTLLHSAQNFNNALHNLNRICTQSRNSRSGGDRIMRTRRGDDMDRVIDLTEEDEAFTAMQDAQVDGDEQMARHLQEQFDREFAVQLEANPEAGHNAAVDDVTDTATEADNNDNATVMQRRMLLRLQRMESRLAILQRRADRVTSSRGSAGARNELQRVRRLERNRHILQVHMIGGGEDNNNLDYTSLLDLVDRIGEVVPQGVPSTVVQSMPVHSYDTPNKGNETSCVICMCDYEKTNKLRHLPCKHTFHIQCIDTWMKKHHSCPICRVDVRLPQQTA